MDCVRAFEKYADRIAYVHLKDVYPDDEEYADRQMSRFCTLLRQVDFKVVCASWKKRGYDGVLCVELDNPPVCNWVSRRPWIPEGIWHNVLNSSSFYVR